VAQPDSQWRRSVIPADHGPVPISSARALAGFGRENFITAYVVGIIALDADPYGKK